MGVISKPKTLGYQRRPKLKTGLVHAQSVTKGSKKGLTFKNQFIRYLISTRMTKNCKDTYSKLKKNSTNECAMSIPLF
uniref:YggT family protein n=1 Tax=Pseudopedinella elastica TaxID=35684 RepID=A0A516ZAF3_9STRA|nr:YggT family protein [Pseudopedinella elastica]QDR24685.1 YggT family protein [Pseudopedinella elastica]